MAPEVPTLIEQGVTGVEIDFWVGGLLVPAGTPREVIARYNTTVNEILQTPGVAEKLTQQGFVMVGGTPERFGELIARDLAKWIRVVNEAGITPE